MNKSKFDPKQIIISPMNTDSYPIGAHSDEEEIQTLFDLVPSSNFVDSVYDWWMEKGFITSLQFDALNRLVEEDPQASLRGDRSW